MLLMRDGGENFVNSLIFSYLCVAMLSYTTTQRLYVETA